MTTHAARSSGLRGWLVGAAAVLVALTVVLTSIEVRSNRREDAVARALTGGDPSNAAALVRRFGCGGCHTIPGIEGADGQVAPSLAQLRQRVFIGGVVRQTPETLVQWIASPQSFSPLSAMPATGISESQARDVAAFLYAR